MVGRVAKILIALAILGVLALIFQFFIDLMYPINTMLMKDSREYAFQIVDICVAELNLMESKGESMATRKAQFLYNIATRFKDLLPMKGFRRLFSGGNAYTVDKTYIYFVPTTVQNIN